MKDSVNILFVCGYGVGSSVMLQTVVKKALAKYETDLRCGREKFSAPAQQMRVSHESDYSAV